VRDVGTKVGRFAELFLAGLALARSWGKAREKSSRPAFAALRASSPRARDAAPAPHHHARRDGSQPRQSRPASLLLPTRGTGLAPLAPDSELCGRCLPFSFRAASPIPFRCPQTSETGDARPCGSHPGGVSRASSVSATCASETGPTRSLADLTPPPILVCPPGSSRRSAPSSSVTPTPALGTKDTGFGSLPDGRTARPPRPDHERRQTAKLRVRLRFSCLRACA